MKRFRLSTLMLLIMIAALGVALAVQQRRAARREAELQARLAELQNEFAVMQMVLAKHEKFMLTKLQKPDATTRDTRKQSDTADERSPR